MSAMSSFPRREELAVPSWPALSITTATALALAVVTPRMPAMNAAACVPAVPIRMVLDSPAIPVLPMSILLLPVVRLDPARVPSAMLLPPVVLDSRALTPLAVLLLPVVFLKSALPPLAVLLNPLVLKWSANTPLAVFWTPLIVKLPAPTPRKVLSEPKLWMKDPVPFRMFPASAVEGTSVMLPVTFGLAAPDSSTVMRKSLLSTAVFTLLKLPFTSEAFAVWPVAKGVSGSTGPAWPVWMTHANSAVIARNLRFVFMNASLDLNRR